MRFDKRYWWLIGVAMAAHIIAVGCTVYTIEMKIGIEANPVAANTFNNIGYLGAFILSTMLILSSMISIPYLLCQNEKMGLLALIPELCIIGFLVIDAANDIFLITGHHYLSSVTFILIRGIFCTVGLPFGSW